MSWTWGQQIYAHKKQRKRNNNYFALVVDNTFKEPKREFLDYIIEGYAQGLYNQHKFLELLKPGGRYYVRIKFLSEQEYEDSFNILKVNYKEHLSKPKHAHEPHFTKITLEEFISKNGLTIENEEKDGEFTIYVFRKS